MKFTIYLKLTLIIYFITSSSLIFGQVAFTLGSDSYDISNDIVIDDQDNIFVIGTFRGTIDFDLTSETFELSHDGQNHKDIFIASYNSNGDLRFAFALKAISENYDEEALGLTLDNSGNIYVTGLFNGVVDFDPSSETTELVSDNAFLGNGFLASYNNLGELRFAFTLSTGSFLNLPLRQLDIQSDENENCYMSGVFQGIVDFDLGTDVFELNSNGSESYFLVSYTNEGELNFATNLFYTFDVFATDFDFAVDKAGNSYIASRFNNSLGFDFDPSIDTFEIANVNSGDIFVSSYSNQGNFLNAFKIDCETFPLLGIPTLNVDVDIDNNINLSGLIRGETDFDPSLDTLELSTAALNIHDFFLSSYTNDGSLRYAFLLSQEENQFDTIETIIPYNMISDIEGNIYVNGIYNGSIDFDPSNGFTELDASQNGSNPDKTDIFTASYDNQGNLRFATKLGLDDNNITSSFFGNISVNSSLKSCICGSMQGDIEYDIVNQEYNISWNSIGNAFVTCYSSEGTLVSINEYNHDLTKDVLVFPNPTNQIINIEVDENIELFTVQLININGQVLLKEIENKNKSFSIDISNYPQGYYIISISNDKKKISKSIIISR